jgi:hypothetical protein
MEERLSRSDTPVGGEATANGIHFGGGGGLTGEARKLRSDPFFDRGDGGARDYGYVREVNRCILKRDVTDAGGLREFVGYNSVEVVRAVVVGPDGSSEVERGGITVGRGWSDPGEVYALVGEAP